LPTANYNSQTVHQTHHTRGLYSIIIIVVVVVVVVVVIVIFKGGGRNKTWSSS